MKKNFVVLILVVSGLVVFAGCNTPADTEVTDQEVVAPQLKGPYLGQKLPGDEAEIFAEGIVTNRMMNRDIAVSKDGNEIYFSIGSNRFATIAVSRQVDGIWSQPEVLPFATDPKFAYMEPALSHDDQRLYFLSNRNPEGQEPGRGWAHQHIWYSERGEDGVWGEMKELGSPINGEEHDYFPSFTDDGTMYYTWSKKGARLTHIYRSRLVDGKYQEPEKLPEEVNASGTVYNAYIAPDESYLLACVGGREDSLAPGMPNYYVYFRYEDDSWSEAINLGEKVNFPGVVAQSQNLSRDGKYLFFAGNPYTKGMPEKLEYAQLKEMSEATTNQYWIDASFIEGLRPEK